MVDISRRAVLASAAAVLLAGAAPEPEGATIAWPSDVPGWDPNLRAVPRAQSLYKLIYDPALDLDPGLRLTPALVSAWDLAPDALSLTVDLRDDVTFHNGDKLSSADFRWTFLGRARAGQKSDLAASWPLLRHIETPSATRAIMHFDGPLPSAPVRLASLASFVVPQAAMQAPGAEPLATHPIGTGPYKLAGYEDEGRIVLERNEAYWGPRPKLRRLSIDIIHEPAARAAAVEAGRVDLAVDVPAAAMAHLAAMPGLVAESSPDTRMILLQTRSDQGFADPAIRLAAHHAIDKKALSQAVFGGAALPLSVLAIPGTPAAVDDYVFAYDPALSRLLLAKSGYGQGQPVRIRLATTNGEFAGDFDIARAIAQMWQAVGIAAELEVIEYTKYADLNRANYLPEATLYALDNPTGDPELGAGALLNPASPISAWKDMVFGQKIAAMASVTDPAARLDGWRALEREATEIGAAIPLLQAAQGVVRKKKLGYTNYLNGWVLGQTLAWS
jgi:peptide/nickel transport system substrate-binding protein